MSYQPIRSILLIDDDPIANMISTKIIERTFALKVVAFTNAIEALQLLKEHPSGPESFPAVIFLDINMPHMDGWEFLEEFQKLDKNILANCTVIMLTSSIDIEDIERSKTYNCVNDFISKPLTQDKVRTLLNGATEKTV